MFKYVERARFAIGIDADYRGCASCQRRLRCEEMVHCDMECDDVQHLLHTKAKWELVLGLGIGGRKAHTGWFDRQGLYWAVDPLLMDRKADEADARSDLPTLKKNMCGYFCKKCRTKKCKRHSRIKEFDLGVPFPFGDRSLSLLNRIALSPALGFLVTTKLYSSGGSASSAALKSHTFCVPHNGIETLSEGLGTFGVNKGVSKTFTLQFIGEGSVSVALRNQGRFNHVVGIDVELCLQWLAYQKAAGYPDIVPGKLFDIRHSSKM